MTSVHSTPILNTPIEVGMCFGSPHRNGIKMVLIISTSIPDGDSEVIVHYVYFSCGKVSVHKRDFSVKRYVDGKVKIGTLWSDPKMVLL